MSEKLPTNITGNIQETKKPEIGKVFEDLFNLCTDGLEEDSLRRFYNQELITEEAVKIPEKYLNFFLPYSKGKELFLVGYEDRESNYYSPETRGKYLVLATDIDYKSQNGLTTNINFGRNLDGYYISPQYFLNNAEFEEKVAGLENFYSARGEKRNFFTKDGTLRTKQFDLNRTDQAYIDPESETVRRLTSLNDSRDKAIVYQEEYLVGVKVTGGSKSFARIRISIKGDLSNPSNVEFLIGRDFGMNDLMQEEKKVDIVFGKGLPSDESKELFSKHPEYRILFENNPNEKDIIDLAKKIVERFMEDFSKEENLLLNQNSISGNQNKLLN